MLWSKLVLEIVYQRNPEDYRAATPLKEKTLYQELQLLPFMPSWCPWLPTDVSKESRNAILHMSTDPAKWKESGFSQGPAQLLSGEGKMKDRKLFFWCRMEQAEVTSCAVLASASMRVVSEPNIEVLFSVMCTLPWWFSMYSAKSNLIFIPLRVSLYQTRLPKDIEDAFTWGYFQEEFNKVTNKAIEVLFTEE